MRPEEYNFRDYDKLERPTPVLEIDYGGRTMSLTYDNTAIFSFSEPFEVFTSIFHNDPDLGVMTFFDSDDLLDQLRGFRFPEYREPYPDEKSLHEYFNWHSQVLEKELGQLAMGNEVEDFETEEDDDEPPGHSAWDWGFED